MAASLTYAACMVRSGKLLAVLVFGVAVLVGCASTAPALDVTPEVTASAEPAECRDGLAEALDAFASAQPLGDRLPENVVVTEFPEQVQFESEIVDALSGCVISLESSYAGGDRMLQIFGIADGLDEAAVIAALESAGWAQPDASGNAPVWQLGDDPANSVALYPRGGSDLPLFGFPGWADYLGPDDVLLTGGIRM